MPLIAELQRRNVFKVGAAYLALAWIVVQITATLTPAFHLPESALPLVSWIGAIGFPFVLLFAWVFELTPEGLKRESEIDRSRSITHITSRKLDYTIIALLVAAIAITLLDRFVPAEKDSRAEARPTSAQQAADGTADVGRASARQDPTGQAATPDDKSIAVLPFVNMSSDKEQEYFSDGIAEELLNLLAKIPELKVIARTSSFAFKGKEVDIADIASRLNVAHVLEGSVRKSGNKVRITAQLIRTADSVHLWSETYDRSLDDIFAVQDEIARAVVEQLKVALLGAAPKAKATNPQAFALSLQARHMANQLTVEGNDRAVVLYRQVLALEPGSASAWEGLARVYNNMASTGQLSEPEANVQSQEAAAKALASDPGYALAHARLGFLALNQESDLGSAAASIRRALELAPSDPDVLGIAATLMEPLGRLDVAIAIGEYTTARDPVNALAHRILCLNQVLAGHWDAAITSCNTALGLSPEMTGVHYQVGLALLGKGDAAAALAEFEQEKGDEEYRVKGSALAFYTLGRQAEFEQALQTMRERWGKTWPSEIAQVYAWSGNADQAFAWLDKALAQKEGGMATQHLLPFYTPVHDDPRWQAFRERTGTAEAQLAAIAFDVTLPQ